MLRNLPNNFSRTSCHLIDDNLVPTYTQFVHYGTDNFMDSILFDKLLKINIENKSEFQNFGAHTNDTFFFVARFTGITQILSPKTCFTHICTFVAIASEHIFMVIEADYMEKISFNTRFTNFFIYTRLTILRTLLTETIFSSFSIIPMIACVAFVF